MKFKFLILSALSNVVAHKVRSFLTILGILIGVAAIIAVMSIGEGAANLVMREIDQMGANTVSATPGNIESGFIDYFFVDKFNQDDLDALLKPVNVPNIRTVAPAVMVPSLISYRGESYSEAIIMGSIADFFTETYNMVPEKGVNFTSVEINNSERVVIIGSKVKEELFGLDEAVGERVMIGGTRFLVVGVYASRGYIGPLNMDNFVLLPYSSAQMYVTGNNEFEEFYIKIDDAENVNRAVIDITATLRETRNIQPGEEDDFSVMTQESMQKMIGDVLNILNGFLIFVVSISLLVGGIGIMNIMLVSVTERTKEIGLRKALGATKKAIREQFLWEAITLTVFGGVMGIFVGTSISFGVSLVLSNVLLFDWPFNFSFEAVLLGVGMSALVGLIFGIYPAQQAAEKDPIEALQYEK
jgi:putative ABC transport system permease protein